MIERGIVSELDRQRSGVRWTLGGLHVVLFVVLVIVGLAPTFQ